MQLFFCGPSSAKSGPITSDRKEPWRSEMTHAVEKLAEVIAQILEFYLLSFAQLIRLPPKQ